MKEKPALTIKETAKEFQFPEFAIRTLVNFKYYGVNIPQGMAIEVSRESGFTSGLIDFRALCIADGKPIVPGAFVKLTVSAD